MLTIFKRTFAAFRVDNATRSAAALSYYAVFSIVPMLVSVIAVAGLVFGKRAAEAEILSQLAGVLGTATADAIRSMLQSAAETKAGVTATLIGLITFVFGTAAVLSELRAALNKIWKNNARKGHVLSYVMVLGVGVLMMVSLVFDGGITTMGAYASHHLLGGGWLWKLVQLSVSAAVATALFAMIFRFLPDQSVTWREVLGGAAVTAVLFVLGKFVLGTYLSQAAVGSSFGAAGSIIVVLVWIYWSALIFLFGVEFTHVYSLADQSAAMPEEATA